jgi:hypothetical protein
VLKNIIPFDCDKKNEEECKKFLRKGIIIKDNKSRQQLLLNGRTTPKSQLQSCQTTKGQRHKIIN